MNYHHQSVLVKEVLEQLALKPNDNVVDGTVGGGGHAAAILETTAPNGILLGLDIDPEAIKAANKNLSKKFSNNRFNLINDSYTKIKKHIYVFGSTKINAIFLDLGLSSAHLEERRRGFTFQGQGILDMRFDQSDDTLATAKEIVNSWSISDLTKIFKEYGEEPLAKRIAEKIGEIRKEHTIKTTQELVEIINQVYQEKLRSSKKQPWIGGKHPATKIFQALRLAVNQELAKITEFLPQALEILETGGRLAIISFHSLEDRLVKNFFRDQAKDCLCPPPMPVCRCDHQASVKLITRRAIKASPEELADNPRARSARLRVIEKL